VIGEAVRALPDEGKSDPAVPWAAIAGLRNVVVHEYFRVDPAMIEDIVDHELVPLAELIRRRRGTQEWGRTSGLPGGGWVRTGSA